jgi:hypothetical protein
MRPALGSWPTHETTARAQERPCSLALRDDGIEKRSSRGRQTIRLGRRSDTIAGAREPSVPYLPEPGASHRSGLSNGGVRVTSKLSAGHRSSPVTQIATCFALRAGASWLREVRHHADGYRQARLAEFAIMLAASSPSPWRVYYPLPDGQTIHPIKGGT